MEFNVNMLSMMREEMIKMRATLNVNGKEIYVPTGTETGDMRWSHSRKRSHPDC